MIMRIAFDIHGVLSNKAEIIDIVRALHADGHFLYVISGKPTEYMYKELLEDYGYTRNELCMFTQFYSIVEHIQSNHPNVKTWVEGDNWWVDLEDYWWEAKAEIAERIDLDLLIDDNIKYKTGYLEFRLAEYKVFMDHPDPTSLYWLKRSGTWPRWYPKLTPKSEVPVRVITQEDIDAHERINQFLLHMLTMQPSWNASTIVSEIDKQILLEKEHP